MQFVMKQNTLVCPFAAPFEVDVHKTPQSILLEGKYWKRKCNVITAEYKKWRRFYVSKALGANNIVDTTSELDFLEWSPRSSESLFLVSDNMPNDTLISTLSQYPFSLSRDIAPGTSRAEFIQPSLAQLEDLMDLDFDLLNGSRLPSVPEEGSDDVLRVIDYSESIGTAIGQDSSLLVASLPDNNNSSGITDPGRSSSISQHQHQSSISAIAPSTIDTVFVQTLTDAPSASSPAIDTSTFQQQPQLGNVVGPTPHLGQQPAIVSSNVPLVPGNIGNTASSDEINKNSKARTCRSLYKPLGRPHNYDRSEPTTHQRLAYSIVSQPRVAENTSTNFFQSSAYQVQPAGIIEAPRTSPNQSSLTYNIQPQSSDCTGTQMNLPDNTIAGSSTSNMVIQSGESKHLIHSQSLPVQNQATDQISPRSVSMPAAPNYSPMLPTQDTLQASMLQSQQRDAFKGFVHPQTSSYKPYHSHQPPYKVPAQNTLTYGSTGRSMRHSSPPHGHQAQNVGSPQQPSVGQSQQRLQDLQLQQQQPQPQQNRLSPHPDKAMYRSHSLPNNASFAVPRAQLKQSTNSRTRSNSTATKQPGSSNRLPINAEEPRAFHVLFPANSESALARLLTNNDIKWQNTSGTNVSRGSYEESYARQMQQQQQEFGRFQQPAVSNPLSSISSPLQLSLSQPNLQLPQVQSSAPSSSSVLSFAPSPSYSVAAVHDSSIDSIMDNDAAMSPAGNVSGLSEANNTSVCSPNAVCGGNNTRGGNSTRACGNSTCLGDCTTCTAGCGTSTGVVSNRTTRTDSQRRSGHLHAEQKRRYNIKSGFDVLHSLIPQLQQNPTAKLSKAAMLQKGAEYIRQLRSERDVTIERINVLRRELNGLSNSVSNLQTTLPASGAPLPRQRTGHAMEQFHQNVRQGSTVNWKYWIFGLIFEPLMLSFDQNVSDASLEELCRSCALWVDQHCSLVETRPAVSNKLCQLSTQTDILSDPPTSLEEEAMKAIAVWLSVSSSKSDPNSNSSKHHDNDPSNPKPGPSGYK